jgi:hypothetical protein
MGKILAVRRVYLPGHAPFVGADPRGSACEVDARIVEVGKRALAVGQIYRRGEFIQHFREGLRTITNGAGCYLNEAMGSFLAYQ